jgi:hypothetical protein
MPLRSDGFGEFRELRGMNVVVWKSSETITEQNGAQST